MAGDFDTAFGVEKDNISDDAFFVQGQIHDEEFAYQRCLSRLMEMQTEIYQNRSL